jgi:hypothetical protein
VVAAVAAEDGGGGESKHLIFWCEVMGQEQPVNPKEILPPFAFSVASDTHARKGQHRICATSPQKQGQAWNPAF